MIINFLCYLLYIIILMCSKPAYLTQPYKDFDIHLTISAQTRSLEVSWENARLWPGDIILITTTEPFEFRILSDSIYDKENLWHIILDRTAKLSNKITRAIGLGQFFDDTKLIRRTYEYNNNTDYGNSIRAVIIPKEKSQWLKTLIDYDIKLSNIQNKNINCYGYWVSYIDKNGNIIVKNCLKAYPIWMNEMKDDIGELTIKDLLIPGTHNSGSYKPGFNPNKDYLDIFQRFTLTQDEDVWEQLMHGIRYLDIRVGYYDWKPEKFFTNHDVSRQRPLVEILEHVREFVKLTNEIVIVDFQEFPVGFHNNQTIHDSLISLIKRYFGGYIILPGKHEWNQNLNEIWSNNQNIFVAYDYLPAVQKHSDILFHACRHRWARAPNYEKLRNYIRNQYNYDTDFYGLRRYFQLPTVDMAELTADVMGILTGKFTGLRKMADSVNSKVTLLYQNELGDKANVVAVDFYRGTRIVDLAIKFNKKRKQKSSDD
ncbi:uncharacterized protein LOC129608324 [Condylostylus longicornis]|uniref:uncharacterized protein LOC129608324 n=1 Tax=Condylostylus longicornis TaxID=2530218 RepID=UPI00244E1699|nr:uncharacterized protein LOC129608324 [Condylostylus longicornis]